MNHSLYSRILFCLFVCVLLGCSRSTQDYSQENLEEYLHQKIAVAYADFGLATDALQAAITEQCTEGLIEEGRAVIQENWKNSNAAWQRVQIINFGPVAEQNRAHDIAFYPSSRANLEKRVAALLESDTDITAENLNAGGVSLRGLPAMEYLLFVDPDPAQGNPSSGRRCDYLTALAALLKKHSSFLASHWRTSSDNAAASGGEKAERVPLENLLNGINERLSVIIAIKLEKALDGSVDALESPYSQQTLVNINNNFAFIQDLYGNHEKEGILRFLATRTHDDIAKEMSIRLNLLKTHLDQLDADFDSLKATPEGSEKLRMVSQLFRSVQEYHATKVADALGVYIGFNSADGD